MTDTELKVNGLKILAERLGIVEAERFITLMLREPFDYTKWRKELFEDISLEELHRRATLSEANRATAGE